MRARFKGAVLRHTGPWLRKRVDSARLREALASLPAEVTRGLDPEAPDFGALPSTWYDFRLYEALFDALLAATKAEDRDELAREAAHAVLSQTLRGIYARLFALMATPGLYARYAQKMWETHYDTGRVTVEHSAPNVVAHTVEDWAGHHEFACAINRQSGAILYSMMGLKDVRMLEQHCASPRCRSVYTWAR